MRVVGILGGVASGKSLVAERLARRGAVVWDADRAGHEVLRMPQVRDAIRRRWGDRVIGADGEVNRQAVAAIVFGASPDAAGELAFLEQLTHPRIGELLRQQLASLASRTDTPLVVLDAAVMLKAGWDRFCDVLLFVDAPPDVRLARALSRGWTAAQFAAREAMQEPIEQKRSRADRIVFNGGTLEELDRQIDDLWPTLSDCPTTN